MKTNNNKVIFKALLAGLIYSFITWYPVLFNNSNKILSYLLCVVAIILFNVVLVSSSFKRIHLNHLLKGYYLLVSFLTFCLTSFVLLIVLLSINMLTFSWNTFYSLLWVLLCGSILFWNAIIRVFSSSVQLGLRSRILGVIFGMVPILNFIIMLRWLFLIHHELTFEKQKEQEYLTSTKDQCLTKYPILFVHGVFFRDSNVLNYWGRIPYHLTQKGAQVFYAKQDSALSVEETAQQIKDRILEIVNTTNYQKVNIIAHSKGGLDSRYAISCLDIAEHVASLTTINTPHNGCKFAGKILIKSPDKVVRIVARLYNSLFKILGDKNADFIASVHDLTYDKCDELNIIMKNNPNVFYQGYISKVKKATHARFPLSLSYPIVKHYDGENDGLVSIESAKSFVNTTIIENKGNRGISHADIIDLHRENIKGFDVRKFYEEIVIDLKQRGY